VRRLWEEWGIEIVVAGGLSIGIAIMFAIESIREFINAIW
jgi:hypothetical protein